MIMPFLFFGLDETVLTVSIYILSTFTALLLLQKKVGGFR